MTRRIEQTAAKYLLEDFRHPTYEFRPKRAGDAGFDLWLFNRVDQSEKKFELKANTGTYGRARHLFERLFFNAEIERTLFESGESAIARVFTGDAPFRVFIITNKMLSGGASLQAEARYVVRGKINYEDSFTEMRSDPGKEEIVRPNKTVNTDVLAEGVRPSIVRRLPLR